MGVFWKVKHNSVTHKGKNRGPKRVTGLRIYTTITTEFAILEAFGSKTIIPNLLK